MTFENKKNLIISCLMIAFLIIVSIWQIKRLDRLESPLAWPEISQLREETPLPSVDEIIKEAEKQFDTQAEGKKSLTEISFQEETIEQKIKFEYPTVWKTIKPSLVEEFTRIEYQEMNILFFAYSEDVLQPLSFIVLETAFKNKAEALNKIGSIYDSQDINMKTIDIMEDNGQVYFFEAAYEKENEIIFSKEKFIFLEEKSYLLSVFGLENSLERYAEIISRIFNSIQIIK